MNSLILRSLLFCAAVALVSGCSLTNDSSGDEILFVRETAERAAIYLMTHDGREVRRVVEGTSPRWSPDGESFAYTVDYEGEETRYCGTSIWVMNPDTGARRRVANVESGRLICSLAWARDGVRLAYDDGSRTVVKNIETGASDVVSLNPVPVDSMDWSHDGREIILAVGSSSWLLDTRTGAERAIIGARTTGNHDGNARWSPDGERIAFARIGPLPLSKRTRQTIVVADADGRNPEQVTRGPFDTGPAWSPDGNRVYFSRIPATWLDEEGEDEQEIYVFDLETRALRRLTTNNVADRSPDVRPKEVDLPPVPEPVVGDVVVPNLVGRYVQLEDEKRRFRRLGLTLQAVPPLLPTKDGVLSKIWEQVPRGGARIPRGSVVKINGSDLSVLYLRGVFSAPIWRANPGCAGSPGRRLEMYGDLVRRVLRRGITRDRVVSLLGEPGHSTSRRWAWALHAVTETGAQSVDCIYLRIEFDRKGRATRFYQWAN